MSADNWTICPNCKQKREAIANRHQAAVYDLYGKVPMDAFLKALNDPKNDGEKLADELCKYADADEETMREDYEQGVDRLTGVYYCNYSCYCTKCEFTWSNKIEVLNVVNEGKSRR